MTNNLTEDTYYQQSADWAYDVYQSQAVWLRRLLVALVLLFLLLIISLLINLMLVPLKEKVPYLYAFDHATGEITKIGTLEPTTLDNNWELSRYLLSRYIIQYESYDFDNIDVPYQMVWVQSSDNVKKQYEEAVLSSNPNSPYRTYGKDKYITVNVISINKLNDNTVDVKFEKHLHDRSTEGEQIIAKEAIIKWQYTQAEATQKMLDRDPLGFKVTYYQTTQINLDNH